MKPLLYFWKFLEFVFPEKQVVELSELFKFVRILIPNRCLHALNEIIQPKVIPRVHVVVIEYSERDSELKKL